MTPQPSKVHTSKIDNFSYPNFFDCSWWETRLFWKIDVAVLVSSSRNSSKLCGNVWCNSPGNTVASRNLLRYNTGWPSRNSWLLELYSIETTSRFSTKMNPSHKIPKNRDLITLVYSKYTFICIFYMYMRINICIQFLYNKSLDSSIPYHHPQTTTKHIFLCFARNQNYDDPWC